MAHVNSLTLADNNATLCMRPPTLYNTDWIKSSLLIVFSVHISKEKSMKWSILMFHVISIMVSYRSEYRKAAVARSHLLAIYMLRCHWAPVSSQAKMLTSSAQVDLKYHRHIEPLYNFSLSPSIDVLHFVKMFCIHKKQYSDFIMRAMVSQITSLTIVYSTVYSGADKKHQSSTSLAFVRGIHRWPLNFPHSNAENVSIWWRHRESNHTHLIHPHQPTSTPFSDTFKFVGSENL